jgi:3-hydroxybutyryl-CoA dehydrogenase
MGKNYHEAFAPPFANQGAVSEQIVVVGGGTMGVGIALAVARGGYDVELVEPQDEARQRGREYIARETQRSGDPSIAERIAWKPTIPQRSDAAVAIEAVVERYEIKRAVFIALAQALGADALLATNTSSLPVADLADVVAQPERVLGLHFFNPPTRMALVEVVRAPQTSDDALERAFELIERIGKNPVVAADTPGFIVNRVARPYYLQALRALDRGVASAQELDALARGVGFRMGPFELIDLIGLDINLATSESIYARTSAARLAPVALQREMVAQGLLGRKSGEGFYNYRDGNPPRFDPAAALPEPQANDDESVAVIGFGGVADEFAHVIQERFARTERIENDEALDELSPETTILVDVGDGASDRSEVIAQLDARLGAETVLFADAYATDLAECARRLRHPERLVGYGVLASLADQRVVEIVDSEAASDDSLELAQDFFASLGKGTVLVEDAAGLFLGRTVGSVVNEAIIAVQEHVAVPDDIDAAMRLGANYPIGPIAWGREIGGARVTRILKRLADAEGEAFAPHRALWVLDVESVPESDEAAR